ncbi:hypothetical protein D3C78_1788060 [compost metagenome]
MSFCMPARTMASTNGREIIGKTMAWACRVINIGISAERNMRERITVYGSKQEQNGAIWPAKEKAFTIL